MGFKVRMLLDRLGLQVIDKGDRYSRASTGDQEMQMTGLCLQVITLAPVRVS